MASENPQYDTFFANSAKLADEIAKLGIARPLADKLKAAKVIGDAIRDRAYIAGPEVTEQMRVTPIIEGMLAKIKVKKTRYAEFRDVLLKLLGDDSDTIEPLIPEL